MTKHLAKFLCALTVLTASSPALAIEERSGAGDNQRVHELQISKAGDTELSCGDLSAEAANMRDVIYGLQRVKNMSEIQSHGVTAAGAVGSFLIGSVTGGIGLAIGGFLLDYNLDEREDKADKYQDIAEQRRTLMMGIYNAKGCLGPIEHAMQNPDEFSIKETLTAENGYVYQADLRTRYNE